MAKNKTTADEKILKKLEKKANFQSLLLPRAMFRSAQTQLIVSLMLLLVLGMQLYIFIGLSTILQELMSVLPIV